MVYYPPSISAHTTLVELSTHIPRLTLSPTECAQSQSTITQQMEVQGKGRQHRNKKITILERGSVSYYEIYLDQVWFILPALELLPLNSSRRRSVTSIGAATSMQAKQIDKTINNPSVANRSIVIHFACIGVAPLQLFSPQLRVATTMQAKWIKLEL